MRCHEKTVLLFLFTGEKLEHCHQYFISTRSTKYMAKSVVACWLVQGLSSSLYFIKVINLKVLPSLCMMDWNLTLFIFIMIHSGRIKSLKICWFQNIQFVSSFKADLWGIINLIAESKNNSTCVINVNKMYSSLQAKKTFSRDRNLAAPIASFRQGWLYFLPYKKRCAVYKCMLNLIKKCHLEIIQNCRWWNLS